MDKDGKRIEIFCGGLRNPYGIAFNRHGEAFTYDADAENDMGNALVPSDLGQALDCMPRFSMAGGDRELARITPTTRTTLSQPHMSERVRLLG